jgi:hypothetical protein
MEDLGADKNISQGFDGSILVGYESSVFQEDVFACKMSKKMKAGKNK